MTVPPSVPESPLSEEEIAALQLRNHKAPLWGTIAVERIDRLLATIRSLQARARELTEESGDWERQCLAEANRVAELESQARGDRERIGELERLLRICNDLCDRIVAEDPLNSGVLLRGSIGGPYGPGLAQAIAHLVNVWCEETNEGELVRALLPPVSPRSET